MHCTFVMPSVDEVFVIHKMSAYNKKCMVVVIVLVGMPYIDVYFLCLVKSKNIGFPVSY